ncbi:hypothetical protein DEDE109153_06820 [Deinococcus deserti]|uniref:Uncharacterized protein n=1 Tax=Deinococcus deserti (strain DSM 17065 / CIP 109153 / LMG 22923 / VCD115) TaxID=546414 RepID=C1CZQ6_DEIDV|nr:hypothetical protein [Deinococcus deserti]ACO47304.1 Conserved hypothetical protein, precursor [Deinococcus deserti VCD115]
MNCLPFLIPALVLAACGAAPSAADGGRPTLLTGVKVRFPAAPADSFLSLVTAQGESVYQLPVPAGATALAVNPARWAGASARAQELSTLLPAGMVAGSLASGTSAGKVTLLEWLMWRDHNTNGARDAGEVLPLMSHDRVVYSTEATDVSFRSTAPEMQQRWTFKAGWSRAEHYVYLPLNSTTYQRSLSSTATERYTLHEPTPLTSQ